MPLFHIGACVIIRMNMVSSIEKHFVKLNFGSYMHVHVSWKHTYIVQRTTLDTSYTYVAGTEVTNGHIKQVLLLG